MTPKISIVIPIYNSGQFISDAINSILAQTIQDFEIIIVDGGSTDDGIKMVEAFNDDRIILIRQQNQGVSSARNQGVMYTKAEIIAFLDADDQWRPCFLETILRLSEKYPLAGAYTTGILTIMDNKKIYQSYRTIPNNGYEGLLPNYFKTAITDKGFIKTSSFGLKKAIFLEFSGFKEGVVWGEDHDLWARIALKYSIAFSSKICSIYFVRDSTEKMARRVAITKEHPFIQTGTEFLLTKNLNIEKYDDLLKYISELRIQSALYNLRIGNSKVAREILINCRHKNYEIQKNLLLLWTLFPELFYKKFGILFFRFCFFCIVKSKKISGALKEIFIVYNE